MRTTFQVIFFIAYMAALVWGGWYVLSGQMVADREAAAPAEPTDVAVEETVNAGTTATTGENPPAEQL